MFQKDDYGLVGMYMVVMLQTTLAVQACNEIQWFIGKTLLIGEKSDVVWAGTGGTV